MTSDWDDHAEGWDEQEGAREYAAAAFESLETLLVAHGESLHGASVLDFGCGTGLLTERLAPLSNSVTAVDTSAAMLDILRAKVASTGWTNVEVRADVPTAAGHFDLVVCSSVCSFLPDYPATARELVALLRPGGVFVQWDWELDESEEDSHGFTPAQITEALTAAGLSSVSVDVAFRIPYRDMEMAPLMGSGVR